MTKLQRIGLALALALPLDIALGAWLQASGMISPRPLLGPGTLIDVALIFAVLAVCFWPRRHTGKTPS